MNGSAGSSGRAWAPDRGSMTVEVAFLLVLLVVPLFYLVGTVGRVQAGAYAVTAGAREAGRSYVTADSVDEAAGRAEAAAGLVAQAHGFAPGDLRLGLACGGPGCLEPGGAVVVDAVVEVPLPLVPDFMIGRVPSTVRLTARHTEPVDEFRTRG